MKPRGPGRRLNALSLELPDMRLPYRTPRAAVPCPAPAAARAAAPATAVSSPTTATTTPTTAHNVLRIHDHIDHNDLVHNDHNDHSDHFDSIDDRIEFEEWKKAHVQLQLELVRSVLESCRSGASGSDGQGQ